MNNLALVYKFLKQLGLDSDFYGLPYDLKIATITFTCKFNTLINVCAIGHYLELCNEDVVCVKYGPDSIVRSLIKLKKNYKVKDPKKKNFQNQVSLMIRIKNRRLIHTKLFSNGTMQITGCKSIFNFVEVMKILCKKLLTFKFAYDTVTKKTIKKVFITNKNNVKVEKTKQLKIRMINSSFHVGFMIDRVVLYKFLLERGFDCTYDQCSHAGINLKYKVGEDSISILIFESGSIIITGAKTQFHIWESYEFIVKLLYDNFHLIVKNNIEKLLLRNDIKKMIEESV